jgi:DNA invertase Pin-like site-specific DNA recombinase
MVNPPLILKAGRAAMYVRMSTEHQQYSTENQADAIEQYADQHNLTIVKKFVDSGKSGVRLSGRVALCELLQEVESGAAEFETILVYDVSRWGRFQDADESAYYEYLCKRAGVLVHYCAEEFQNDGSLSSTLLKTIKRSMAAEYSRELSVKVFAGQSRLVEMGFRQGGWTGFGLRRQLVGRDGKPKGILARGERKSIQTDRIILVPGPAEEVAAVRDIFDLFTVNRLSMRAIARLLNERGIRTDRGCQWNHHGIHDLLTNPKYVGSNVYNRVSFKLRKKAVKNPASMWIRRDGAFEPIVPLETFQKAQEITQSKCMYLSNDQMLDNLRGLWAREGRLSAALIARDKTMPYVGSFQNRFGGLNEAYSMIGYPAGRDHKYQSIKGDFVQRRRGLLAFVKAALRSHGATVDEHRCKSTFTINGQFTATLTLCYCTETPEGTPRWSIRRTRPLLSDITIAARLRPGNSEIFDYLLIPNIDSLEGRIFFHKENPCELDVYRFDNLDFFLNLARRCRLGQTA